MTPGELAAIALVRRLYEVGASQERAEAEVLYAIALEQIGKGRRKLAAAVEEIERLRARLERERARQVQWADEVERRALVLAELRLRDDQRRLNEVRHELRDQVVAFEGDGLERDAHAPRD